MRADAVNEYEVATLAARYAGLWIAAAQVGGWLLQAGIVWYGIRAMQRMGATRTREQDQRHEEAMTALNELIRAGQAQTAALETVIERTTPRARA